MSFDRIASPGLPTAEMKAAGAHVLIHELGFDFAGGIPVSAVELAGQIWLSMQEARRGSRGRPAVWPYRAMLDELEAGAGFHDVRVKYGLSGRAAVRLRELWRERCGG
jgi:hypothetical protein